ncbi:hypothetical protein [Shigella boydii]|uniref:hypothetical protein n=1 Tax=Shigella boydii TaxID=621 RepID=UPI00093F88DB|nr:hypothetical protein [Shigella boydii]
MGVWTVFGFVLLFRLFPLCSVSVVSKWVHLLSVFSPSLERGSFARGSGERCLEFLWGSLMVICSGFMGSLLATGSLGSSLDSVPNIFDRFFTFVFFWLLSGLCLGRVAVRLFGRCFLAGVLAPIWRPSGIRRGSVFRKVFVTFLLRSCWAPGGLTADWIRSGPVLTVFARLLFCNCSALLRVFWFFSRLSPDGQPTRGGFVARLLAVCWTRAPVVFLCVWCLRVLCSSLHRFPGPGAVGLLPGVHRGRAVWQRSGSIGLAYVLRVSYGVVFCWFFDRRLHGHGEWLVFFPRFLRGY